MIQKTKGIIIIVIVVIGASTGVVLFMTMGTPGSTELTYQRDYSGNKPVDIYVAGIVDCEFFLGYTEDSSLMYSIEVHLYEADSSFSFSYSEREESHEVHINWNTNTWGHEIRVKNMTILLGNGHPYRILLGGSGDDSANVTSTVIFNNNATLGDQEFVYNFPGTLNLQFTEDVDISQGGLSMEIGQWGHYIDSLNLHVDLPAGMDGDATFYFDSMSVSTSGWSLYDTGTLPTSEAYQTASTPSGAVLDIRHVYADSISATLYD